MPEPENELMFTKIRIDYPDLPDRAIATLSVNKIEMLPGGTQIKISAKTEKGIRTTIILEK